MKTRRQNWLTALLFQDTDGLPFTLFLRGCGWACAAAENSTKIAIFHGFGGILSTDFAPGINVIKCKMLKFQHLSLIRFGARGSKAPPLKQKLHQNYKNHKNGGVLFIISNANTV